MEQLSSLALALYLQVIVAAGYVAHAIGRIGDTRDDRADQRAYAITVYGLAGTMAGYPLWLLTKSPVLFALAALIAAAACAILWRTVLRRRWYALIRSAGISNSDGIPSLWLTLTTATHVIPTQLSVELDTGEMLSCAQPQRYARAPFPIFGSDGDGNIALYVTHKVDADGKNHDYAATTHTALGYMITYVPKERIARISIRYVEKKDLQRRSRGEGGGTSSPSTGSDSVPPSNGNTYSQPSCGNSENS
jgi:hypothetical protein